MKTVVFALLALACLHPAVPSALGLLAGVAVGLAGWNPAPKATKKWAAKLLTFSVIGLGAGMNLAQVLKVGAQGFVQTAVSISLTLALGLFLGKLLKVERVISLLVSSGTAICGGSAIAAVAAAIAAPEEAVAVSLATVFLLNAAALWIFPPLGHALGMSPADFGLWSALAIHDTSSVVGAAVAFGGNAVDVATTVKLARALWIIPLALLVARFFKKAPADPAQPAAKAKKPWFILGFLLAAALATYVPQLAPAMQLVAVAAKRSLVTTLFLIGSGVSLAALRKTGARPMLHGLALWLIVAVSTLAII